MVTRAVLAAGLLLTLGAVSGLAASTTDTETFTIAEHPAGTPFEWTVPAGVTSLDILAAGGNGGAYADRPGGLGALVTVTVPVVEGQVLAITLGDNGVSLADPKGTAAGGLGYAQGGDGIRGSGGGGSTGIVLDGSPAIVAGAGGGTGSGGGIGGAGGTPAGANGSKNGGIGGSEGVGGAGKGPWGGPGGSGLQGTGGDVGNDNGSGGGAGFGGGGAGGFGGDGAGGGSFGVDGSTFAARSDATVGGWVSITYTVVTIEPTPTATPEPVASAPDFAWVGMVAAGVFVLGLVSLIVLGQLRRRAGR
jgi:hypothetical protein